MNQARFLELLNLYLDHEISPEDAQILEREIRNNPERKKTYETYCRMQKATGALFENSRQQAPSPALARAYAEINQKVKSPAKPQQPWLAWGGGLALASAACVAVVMMSNPSSPTAPSEMMAQTTPSAPALTVAASAPEGQTDALASKANSAFWADSALLTRQAEDTTPALVQTVKFRPINKVQGQNSLFAQELMAPTATDSQPTLEWQKKDDSASDAEMTAVQFKR